MNLTLLKSYAKAIFGISKEKNLIEEVSNDLTFLCSLFKKNPDFVKFLSSPMINHQEKEEMLDKCIKEKVQGCSYAFLKVLLKRHAIQYLEKIVEEYRHIYNENHNILEGRIFTSFLLDEERLRQIEQIFSEKYHKQVVLKNLIDKRVIAGMKIYIADTLYDYSVDSKLNQVRDKVLYHKK
jgi:ATP synthase F1, delta subunit